MARVAIIFGLLLCGLSVIGMLAVKVKVPMQFIPMMLGIPILFCGVVALNPHRRSRAMQAAAAIAALGALGGGGRVLYCAWMLANGGEINRYGFRLVVAMSAACAVLVVICLVGLSQARRRKLTNRLSTSSGPRHLVTPPPQSPHALDVTSTHNRA